MEVEIEESECAKRDVASLILFKKRLNFILWAVLPKENGSCVYIIRKSNLGTLEKVFDVQKSLHLIMTHAASSNSRSLSCY